MCICANSNGEEPQRPPRQIVGMKKEGEEKQSLASLRLKVLTDLEATNRPYIPKKISEKSIT